MNFEQLARLALTNACTQLLPSPADQPAHVRPDELRIAAVIGFTDDHVRGTLGVAASIGGLERVRRHMGAPHTKNGAADALGELANLVLGHIKREWSRYGALVTLSTPLVIRGVAIEICGRGAGHWFEHASGVGGDRLVVWMDVHVDSEPALLAEPTDVGLAAGGDLLLF